jgi:hypothetical protein
MTKGVDIGIRGKGQEEIVTRRNCDKNNASNDRRGLRRTRKN